MKAKGLSKALVGFCLVLVLALTLPLTSACAPAPETPTPTPVPTPTPEPVPTPTPTPTPTPGIGVPVVGDFWQVMVKNAREETRLTAKGSEYTPKSGYTFLVVDVDFQNLGLEKMSVLSGAVAVITEDGETISAAGSGYQGEDPALGYLSMFVVSPEDPLSLSFAFIVEEGTIDQVFKLQLQETPLIPFSVD